MLDAARCSTCRHAPMSWSRSNARRGTSSSRFSSSGCSGRSGRPTSVCRSTARVSTRRASTRTDCRELADLAKLPFTTKEDLRASYPFAMFAVPREQIARIHASSGTTGRATVIGYTKGDLDMWADVVARSIRAAGGQTRRPRPRRLRLRPVHGRPRRPCRRGAARLHRDPRLGRPHRTAGAADRRLRAGRDHGHAVVHARDPRRVRASGSRPARDLAQGRHLRRRAVERRDATRDRASLRHARGRHLRSLRGDRPRRRERVRREQGRAARLGGPLLPGDRRPRDRRGAAGGRAWRARVHVADQGGDAGDPLPDPRPDSAAAREPRARCDASRRSPAAATT